MGEEGEEDTADFSGGGGVDDTSEDCLSIRLSVAAAKLPCHGQTSKFMFLLYCKENRCQRVAKRAYGDLPLFIVVNKLLLLQILLLLLHALLLFTLAHALRLALSALH